MSTVKHLASVMIWGCFSGAVGRGGLYFHHKNRTMNADRYINVLEDHLTDMMGIPGCITFMQTAPPVIKVMKWLCEKKIEVLEWPGNSLDFNPIENAWNVIKKKMQSCHISSISLLQERIKDICAKELSAEYFQNMCESMPKRLQMVIKAKGHTTKY